MSAVSGLVRLSRPGNVIGAAILAFTGAYVAGGLDHNFEMAIAIAATGLGTAAGNSINDYFDREIDAINRPDRPIPSGAVPPKAALYYALLIFAIAVLITVVVLPIAAITIATINLVLLLTYTQFFKGTPGFGNAIIAFLVASAIWFGGAATGDITATLVIGTLAGMATLAREIVKDIEDLEGDKAEGLRTLPLVIGVDRAWIVALFALFVGAVISPAPYLRGTFDAWYFVGLVPALVVMAYAGLISRYQPGRGQRWLKVGMYLALLAFIIGRIEVPL